MNNVLVSVVIPMYNSENYIEETLNSVLSQTYKNLEILIIDDGSTDNSKEKITNINDERIKYIYQVNQGVSTARNNGIKNSSGEYIAFLDSDDLWDMQMIEKLMIRISESKYKAAYCGTIDYILNEGNYKREKIKFKEGIIIYDYLKKNTWPQTGTWLISKEVIDKYNLLFETSSSWGEDYEFFCKIASVTNVCCVKEYLFTYVKRTGSLSEYSINHLSEIDNLIRLSNWIKRNNVLNLNTTFIDNIIKKYRIPTVVLTTMYNGILRDDEFINKHEKTINKYQEYIDNYKLKGILLGNKKDYIKNIMYKHSVNNINFVKNIDKIKGYIKKIKK